MLGPHLVPDKRSEYKVGHIITLKYTGNIENQSEIQWSLSRDGVKTEAAAK